MLTPDEQADMAMINKSLRALIGHFEKKGMTFILGWSLQKKGDPTVMEHILATRATREQYLATTAQWTRHALNFCDGAEGFQTVVKHLHD